MPRRGENIYKRKDGRWEGRYIKNRCNGKIKYGYVYAKTYKEVKDKILSIDKSDDLSEKQRLNTCDSSVDDRFVTIANEWFVSLKPQLKESSIIKYTNILNIYLLPAFGEKEISDIARDEIMLFSNQILNDGGKKGKGLSPKTVSCIISVLKSIFFYAIRTKGYLTVDIGDISVKQCQKPIRVLTRSESKRLSNYLLGNLTLCNLGMLFCLYMGLRVGEICALKWGDISFDDQYLYVRRTMQRIQKKDDEAKKTAILISAPKSDCSIRKIPIPDEIFHLIIDRRYPVDAYFLTGMEDKYIEPRTMQNRFKSVTKNCEINDVNFHALRHTFATNCVEIGFDVKCLSEILGHANVNITLNRYVHPSMELKKKNMNMFSGLFSVI